MRATWLVALLVAAACLRSALAQGSEKDVKALIDYLKDNGAELSITVGKACPDCIRGAIATRDLRAGDVVARIPNSLAIKLEELTGQRIYPAELGYNLAVQMHEDPEFNQTHKLHLAVMPPREDVVTPESLGEELIRKLQSSAMADRVREHNRVAYDCYWGQQHAHLPRKYTPMGERLGGWEKLSYDDYAYLVGLVSSRYVAFKPSPEADGQRWYIYPMVDMINHSERPNAQRAAYSGGSLVVASTAIAKGEEVRMEYQAGLLHRPDQAFFLYGYVESVEPPLLCAMDLPTYQSEHPYAATPADDEQFYGEGGSHLTKKELGRLEAQLAAMGSSAKQDAKLLAKRGLPKRERLVVQFRLARKTALRYNIKRVRAALRAKKERKAAQRAAQQAEAPPEPAAGEQQERDEL